MLRPVFPLLLVAGAVAPVAAQSGTIRYDQATRLEFNLPPNSPMAGRLPRSQVRPMIVSYNSDMVLYAAAPRDPDAEARRMAEVGGREMVVVRRGDGPPMPMPAGAMMTFRAGPGFGGGRGDVLTGAFTNLEDGSIVEVREFLGRTFRIPETRPTIAWKMTGEQAVFLGFPVFQATAVQDSTTIEAWFTPEIPVSAGPAQYGGLPGMILTLTLDTDRVTWTATAIDTAAVVDELKAPTDGDEVTRAEYDKIVAEKLAELQRTRRGRGN